MGEIPEHRWHGRRVCWNALATCASTQDEARDALNRSGDPSTVQVVSADEQTSGRGREGRSWTSNRGGGIYLSVGVPGPLGTTGAEQWSRRIAEAVVGVLRQHTCVGALVREPNDIYVGERKLGGVLIDASSHADRFDRVIVGVGINILGAQSNLDGRDVTSIAAECVSTDPALIAQQRDTLAHAIAHAVLGVIVTEAGGTSSAT